MKRLMLKRREGVEPDADTRSHTAPRRPGRAASAHGVSHSLHGPPPVTLGHAPVAVQAKLTVSHPGDAFEREADSVAERVMRMPDTTVRLQRKCACGGACEECGGKKLQTKRHASAHAAAVGEVSPLVHDALRSSGQPLDATARSFFEQRFGHDFGDVRIHADARGAEGARAVNARAYTVGHDIVFNSGEYAPASTEGRRLLAHELTHVVQQVGPAASPQAAATVQRQEEGEASSASPEGGAAGGDSAQQAGIWDRIFGKDKQVYCAEELGKCNISCGKFRIQTKQHTECMECCQLAYNNCRDTGNFITREGGCANR